MFRYVLLCGLSVAAVGGAMAQTTQSGTGQTGGSGRSVSQATPETGNAVSSGAKAFITQASEGGQFEIKSSELAKQRARSASVKSFAKKMVRDHQEANKKLVAVAHQAGSDVPNGQLQQKHADIVADLKKRSGVEFDRAYMNAQVTAHEETIGLFDSYAKQGDSAPLKQFATTTLPQLRQHLDLAKDVQASLDNAAATGRGSGTSGGKKK